MMNEHKRIANWGWADEGSLSTRVVSDHGLGRGQRRAERIINRQAKRYTARLAFHREEQP